MASNKIKNKKLNEYRMRRGSLIINTQVIDLQVIELPSMLSSRHTNISLLKCQTHSHTFIRKKYIVIGYKKYAGIQQIIQFLIMFLHVKLNADYILLHFFKRWQLESLQHTCNAFFCALKKSHKPFQWNIALIYFSLLSFTLNFL